MVKIFFLSQLSVVGCCKERSVGTKSSGGLVVVNSGRSFSYPLIIIHPSTP